MLRLTLLPSSAALLFAACGGGGDDSGGKARPNSIGGSDATGGGSRAMAAFVEAEFTRLKNCFQAQADGKGDCKEDLLTNRVTGVCSAVRTRTRNDLAVTDVKPFEPVCSSCSARLARPSAEKPGALAGMIEKVKAIN